ncbi:putative reverse transcriptase domain-containing protein [Tanacetum coccineum]|uniref:Reverse transcriptase domain-containing protein n=1 Tax=Tanacetum coccineum TaxID=301880 RepID=A0ABQ5CLL6_9ASTR
MMRKYLNGVIPRVIVLGYDGLPLQPVAPPSPDFILGPENPQTLPVPQEEDEREPMFIQAHDPNYVPEPIYPKMEENDGDDDDGNSSRDDARDEDKDEEDEEDEEEEEHLAPFALIDEVTTALPSPPLPPLPPSLSLPSPVDRRDDIPESEQPPRKRLHLSTIYSRYEIGESSTARPAKDVKDRLWLYQDSRLLKRGDMGIREVGMDSWILCRSRRGSSEIAHVPWIEDAQGGKRQYVWWKGMRPMLPARLWAPSMSIEPGDSSRSFRTHRDHVLRHGDLSTCTPDTATAAKYSHSDTAPGQTGQSGTIARFQITQEAIWGRRQSHLWYFLTHYGNFKAAKPKTLDEIIELANDLMDRKLLTYAKKQSDNKRKADDSFRNNHGHQQQPFKRQNVAKVYNMDRKEAYGGGGSLPKCNKCHLHHNGPCTQRCHKCNKIGHFARDCRSTGNSNVANTQKGNGGSDSLREWFFLVWSTKDTSTELSKTKELKWSEM